MAKTILILGASYAGLQIAHKLLKVILKSVKEDYAVVVVSSTTHHYLNIASIRAIVPGQISDENIFASIPDGLRQYGEAVEFINGTATSFDPAIKTVIISCAGKAREQKYDLLIIATGSRAMRDDLPWKSSMEGYEATKANLDKLREQVKKAKSIVVGGAGPTGVEVVGDLGFEYGLAKEIKLITTGPQILPGLPTHVINFAENELKKLHIDIIKDVKILSSTSYVNGKTSLVLSNSETMVVDLYIPTMGVIPNTEFIPKSLLNEKGKVMVDQFLRVKGVEDVWAAGDVTNLQPAQIIYAVAQAEHLLKNLALVLNEKEPLAYHTDGSPMMGITLGRSKGTGRFGNFRIPSFVVWYKKSRTLGTAASRLADFVNGTDVS